MCWIDRFCVRCVILCVGLIDFVWVCYIMFKLVSFCCLFYVGLVQ